jgi:hypothetical protein
MKTWLAIIVALVALCLGMIAHLNKAHAQPTPCAPLQPLLDRLAKAYHEFIVIRGKAADQQMLVTLSPAGTFSVLLTDGRKACIILAGEKGEIDNGI